MFKTPSDIRSQHREAMQELLQKDKPRVDSLLEGVIKTNKAQRLVLVGRSNEYCIYLLEELCKAGWGVGLKTERAEQFGGSSEQYVLYVYSPEGCNTVDVERGVIYGNQYDHR